MSTSLKPLILLLGRAERAEFRAARAQLEELAEVVTAAGVEAAVELLDGDRPAPELIVVAQGYPGEFSGEAMDRLHRAAPLAPLVALLGSWCQGETRSGRPWPGVVRVYWHQWPAQCRRELGRIRSGQCSTWTLPATATEEERLLAVADRARPKRDGLILLATGRWAMYDWLACHLRRRGCATAWLCPGDPVRIDGAAGGVLDATELTADEIAQLGQLREAVWPGPCVVLLDFPRIEDHDRAGAAGATAVLGKPLSLEDLDDALRGGNDLGMNRRWTQIPADR